MCASLVRLSHQAMSLVGINVREKDVKVTNVYITPYNGDIMDGSQIGKDSNVICYFKGKEINVMPRINFNTESPVSRYNSRKSKATFTFIDKSIRDAFDVNPSDLQVTEKISEKTTTVTLEKMQFYKALAILIGVAGVIFVSARAHM